MHFDLAQYDKAGDGARQSHKRRKVILFGAGLIVLDCIVMETPLFAGVITNVIIKFVIN